MLKEAVGYDQGLWRTFRDLRKIPIEVLNGYMAGDKRYVSPSRLLITTLSFWVLLNGFLIDWYEIWKTIVSGILHGEAWLILSLMDHDEAKRAAFDTYFLGEFAPRMTHIFSRFAGDLFSKWYVPFTILSIVCGGYIFTRKNRSEGYTLKHVLSILSYAMGSNIIVFLAISAAFGIHMWLGCVILMVGLLFFLFGKAHLIFYAAPSQFFEKEGKRLEKKLMRFVFLVVLFLQVLLISAYSLYFIYFT